MTKSFFPSRIHTWIKTWIPASLFYCASSAHCYYKPDILRFAPSSPGGVLPCAHNTCKNMKFISVRLLRIHRTKTLGVNIAVSLTRSCSTAARYWPKLPFMHMNPPRSGAWLYVTFLLRKEVGLHCYFTRQKCVGKSGFGKHGCQVHRMIDGCWENTLAKHNQAIWEFMNRFMQSRVKVKPRKINNLNSPSRTGSFWFAFLSECIMISSAWSWFCRYQIDMKICEVNRGIVIVLRKYPPHIHLYLPNWHFASHANFFER